MDSKIQFDTIRFGWSIIYFEGSADQNFQYKFLYLKVVLVLANKPDTYTVSSIVLFCKFIVKDGLI